MRIADILEEANIAQLAKTTNIDRSYIYDVKNGKSAPSIEKYSRICAALGYDPLKLMKNEDYFIRR